MSCPYTPKQHGMIERRHRQILEVGRCILIKSGIPHEYWSEVLSSATYVINRLKTPILAGKSPFELPMNRNPDYTQLKTIRCTCYISIVSQGR